MTCSREALVSLFNNVSSSSFLLLLLLYLSSNLLLKLINFIGSYPIIQRNRNGYEYNFSDEDEEEENETYSRSHELLCCPDLVPQVSKHPGGDWLGEYRLALAQGGGGDKAVAVKRTGGG
ncbi:hypothetical protein NC652_028757 [Populus alba x Populus x berolinensis]|nr:hypothetical protein NC652_028757 [Populus alba x Populus x berolinensis]